VNYAKRIRSNSRKLSHFLFREFCQYQAVHADDSISKAVGNSDGTSLRETEE
jgi:hypothetical protein